MAFVLLCAIGIISYRPSGFWTGLGDKVDIHVEINKGGRLMEVCRIHVVHASVVHGGSFPVVATISSGEWVSLEPTRLRQLSVWLLFQTRKSMAGTSLAYRTTETALAQCTSQDVVDIR